MQNESKIIKAKNGISRVITQKPCKRNRIIEENLLAHIDKVEMSERNKEIVIKYTNGATSAEISNLYGITSNRVSQIVGRYIALSHKFTNKN